jgi:very-short-patch-repair endonuclease
MLPYKKSLKPFSRQLRNNMTDAEQMLWSRLRRKQILGVQFYRQKPIGGYIADFYSAAAKLVIELDGAQHLLPEHQAQDKERDKLMQAMGLMVIRFDNRQIMGEIDSVMERIIVLVAARINPLNLK